MKKSLAVVAGAVMALGAAVPAFADAGAQGAALHSPGFQSGNLTQLPVHHPVNLCGNTVNTSALLNPAFGNACLNRG